MADDRYLTLLKRTLTRIDIGEGYQPADPPKGTWKHLAYQPVRRALERRNLALVRRAPINAASREVGGDWPVEAETMIGLRRLDNIQECVREIVSGGIPGDLAECGVWRGGAVTFMRAALDSYGDTGRTVYAADSFAGLPKPTLPEDRGDKLWAWPTLAISEPEVRDTLSKYGYDDGRVKLLPGWFKDTLPGPITQLSLLRVDGDLYESTRDALSALGPLVTAGGFIIADDYYSLPAVTLAVDQYRANRGESSPLVRVDWSACCWRVTPS